MADTALTTSLADSVIVLAFDGLLVDQEGAGRVSHRDAFRLDNAERLSSAYERKRSAQHTGTEEADRFFGVPAPAHRAARNAPDIMPLRLIDLDLLVAETLKEPGKRFQTLPVDDLGGDRPGDDLRHPFVELDSLSEIVLA